MEEKVEETHRKLEVGGLHRKKNSKNWYYRCTVNGKAIDLSTGTDDIDEAEKIARVKFTPIMKVPQEKVLAINDESVNGIISGDKSTNYKFIDLFAGIGGIRMAFESANAKCVFSSEWDPSAQKTYEANFHEKPSGDITSIPPDTIPDFDILTGGFPCQPFSMIGKREGFNHKTQGSLFFNITEILRVKKPSSFLLENVPGLLTHDKGRTFKIIMETLSELGYTVSYRVLNSANFGVPQYRQRLYFVGFRKELNSAFSFPVGNENLVGIGQFVEKDAEGPSISEHLQKTYIFKKDDGHPEIIDSNSNFPVKTLCASYHKIQRITGTFVRGGKTGLRLLTERECKAIMGFPYDFIVPVSRTQMYHQFGNSVAIPVVREIAIKIVDELSRVLK